MGNGMSSLITDSTVVEARVIPALIALEGQAVFSSMSNFHAVSTHYWSMPDARGRGMSIVPTGLAVKRSWRRSGPTQSRVEVY
jgi:hypothetical protein